MAGVPSDKRHLEKPGTPSSGQFIWGLTVTSLKLSPQKDFRAWAPSPKRPTR